ncbi:hypothetical protein [Cytobacillus praedii]|uniref:hypothetical protein n=1 Tax=Cytobacillus praedii TaxID=1742358 RepID=UPI002E1E563B|nr:hypothetical protein [Cytobacillus praedii]
MIVLMLFEETNEWTGQKKVLVSHGVDTTTLGNISLPPVPPIKIGYFDESIGEWLLRE